MSAALSSIQRRFAQEFGNPRVVEVDGWRLLTFTDAPFEGCRVHVTDGLARHAIRQRSGTAIHHECAVVLNERIDVADVALFMRDAARHLTNGDPLLRGSLHVSPRPLLESSRVGHYTVSTPVYLPESLHVVADGMRSVHIAWLIPLHPIEVDFIRESGWDAFQEVLVAADPDLTDAQRSPVLVGVRAAEADGHARGSLALASPRVLAGEGVREMFRERAAHDTDSGWRFLSGGETAAELEDAKSARIASLAALMQADSSFASLLESRVGSAFERDTPSSPWRAAAARENATRFH